MFQIKTFLASISANLGAQVRSKEELSDREFTTQRISRRSLFRHTVLVGMAGGIALMVAACSNGDSGSSNDTPTPSSGNNSNDSGSSNSNSGSNNSSNDDGSDDDDGGDDDGGDDGSDDDGGGDD